MMLSSDLYRITHQEELDRLAAARHKNQLREARATEPSLRERLRHLYGMLMTLLV